MPFAERGWTVVIGKELLMSEPHFSPLQRILRQWESPPTWLLLFAALAWGQSLFLPLWDAGGFGDWLGFACVLAGAMLMILSLRQFRQARTTVMPRETARVLMTDGVYQWSRNPIYVADALILTGLALRWDLGALVWVVVFVIVMERRFILGEEAGLRAKFGAQFHEWAAKVRRWL